MQGNTDHMDEPVDGMGRRMRALLREMVTTIMDGRSDRAKEIARLIGREPFTRRSWSEFSFLTIGAPLAAVGLAFVAGTLFAGMVLAITFFGLAVMALSVRAARGFGGFHRQLARGLLDEQIEDPEPFVPRPGFLGWLQSALRDRTGWRSMAYLAVKVPLAALGILVGFAAWWDAFFCITYPVWGGAGAGNRVAVFGLPQVVFGPGFFSAGQNGFLHAVGVFCAGVVFLFAAPWAVRVVVYLDRRVMRVLLAPDALAARVRCWSGRGRSRWTRRRPPFGGSSAICTTAPRPNWSLWPCAWGWRRRSCLHSGTGSAGSMAREPNSTTSASSSTTPTAAPRRPSSNCETSPVGSTRPLSMSASKGALSTLAARSTVPTELTVSLHDRPTPAIEAIAYFCVAELLANVAQHAHASHASIMCTDYGQWLRVVVRDDGTGGAQLSRVGSLSSGLVGLTDRVHAVDGRLDIASPPGGPTVITVDLPLHA